MLKGISDVQQRQIEELIAPFMAIETNMKKNGINLSSETLSRIKEAKSVAEFAVKENLQLPKSTYDILRYGPTIENQIFKNLDKLSSYKSFKVRVRKGVQIQHVLTWDARSIESTLKKTDKPKFKSHDDKKVFKEFLSNFSSFKNYDADLKLFNTYQKLFLAIDSPITAHFLKGNNFLSDLLEKRTKLDQRAKEKTTEQARFDELDKERTSLENKVTELTEKFYSEDKTGKGIRTKKDQIETLQTSEPLASYIKLLSDIIETFDSFATKQNIHLSFDEQNVLRDLNESIISHERSLDQHFTELLNVIVDHSDAAFGKKHWFMKLLQEIGSIDDLSSYLTSGPGFKAWVEAREIAKDVNELQKTPEFENFEHQIAELEEKQKKLLEDITRVTERLRRFKQDVDELESGIETLKSNLEQWTTEAKQLI